MFGVATFLKQIRKTKNLHKTKTKHLLKNADNWL